jgi:hypothetical protein
MPKVLIGIIFIITIAFAGGAGYEIGALQAVDAKIERNEAQLRADLAESSRKTAILLIAVQKKHTAKLKGLLDDTIKIAESMAEKAQACNDFLKKEDEKKGLRSPKKTSL